ncbi:MAG: hypothetical protein QM765_40000 [Myxococcales bacterium]
MAALDLVERREAALGGQPRDVAGVEQAHQRLQEDAGDLLAHVPAPELQHRLVVGAGPGGDDLHQEPHPRAERERPAGEHLRARRQRLEPAVQYQVPGTRGPRGVLQARAQPYLGDQLAQLRLVVEEGIGAQLELVALGPRGAQRAADAVALLEDPDRDAAAGQGQGRRQPAHARTDDDDRPHAPR